MPEAAAARKCTLSAVVISYNTRQMTLDCLRTLKNETANIDAEIWLVDNASNDGSVSAVRSEFPDVKVIENDTNRGFGAGNNQGMKAASGEFFLLINSDAFPKPGAIEALVRCMIDHSKAGVVGPRLLYSDGKLQQSCFRFPSPLHAWLENLWMTAFTGDYRHWPHDRLREVDFVIGACLLVRRQVVEQVGGFDEEFFMYSEEADWQKRIWQAGWTILFEPNAVVTHLAGGSGASDRPRINAHFFDSLDYYELKHHGVLGLTMLRLAMLVGCSLRAVLWAAMCLVPGRSRSAWAKLKMHLWLIRRQATDWRMLRKCRAAANMNATPMGWGRSIL
jgi:GT2 family glycosyltransferase